MAPKSFRTIAGILFFVMLLFGCDRAADESRDLASKGADSFISRAETKVNNKSKEIKGLGRSFLKEDSTLRPYGYYLYLLFPANLTAATAQQCAAASAFLSLFSDISNDENIDTLSYAVFLAPITVEADSSELISQRTQPDILLDSYDFRFAKEIVEYAGLENNRLWLVGYPQSVHDLLFFNEDLNLDDLQALDFTELRPDEIRQQFSDLEQTIINNASFEESPPGILVIFAAVFDFLGGIISAAGTSEAAANPLRCEDL